MAMSGGKDDGSPMMEMNTTPLIDVMLVLLIMFIITIPPQTNAIKIDLPVDTGEPPQDIVDPVRNVLVVTTADTVEFNGQPVSLAELEELLIDTKAFTPEPELRFQPEPDARYNTVNDVVTVINRTEVSRFGFFGNEQYRVFDAAGGGS